MPFTELNAVEHYLIHRLSGTNLNDPNAGEPAPAYGLNWTYKSAAELDRRQESPLVEAEVRDALIRLNPEIAADPNLADEVIHRLRGILLTVGQVGLVAANEQFTSWLRGSETMPFGENHTHVTIRLIDFEQPNNNTYVVTNQYRIKSRETKIPDVVLLINGFPVVVGEAKTPIRPAISWMDGANDIHEIYEHSVPALFVPNVFSFATEGKELYYGAVRTPLQFWGPWRLEDHASAMSKHLGLNAVGKEVDDLLSPKRVLEILENFTLFTTNEKRRRIKVVCRYQQYEAANKIVKRVVEGRVKNGLIWHFQGSGKSLLMLFTAQMLRRRKELRSPTVIILVDRTDLDSQITGTFKAADVANVVTTDSINDLQNMLMRDTRKIIVTTIFKFKDAPPKMNERDNIIVLADEAHRTQEGDLGRYLRGALPNAFLFGLTGTPINKSDKNTFATFGAAEDEAGYLSRYTYQDSLRDGATLPLHFEPRLVDVHIDKEEMDRLFGEFSEASALDDLEADKLSGKAAKMTIFVTAPDRVQKITADIAKHFKQKVEPHGFKAMVVTINRHACVQYKLELDKHFPEVASRVVISTTASDKEEFKARWGTTKDQQDKIVEEFKDAGSQVQFLVVTAKLLTGFDAPILQTMYLDKSLKDHTLLQAVTRANRRYPDKHFGRIVDYFGVFDDAAKALEFDEESVRSAVTNFNNLIPRLAPALTKTLAHFPGVDRRVIGFEGLEAAQEAIRGNEAKDAFAADFKQLAKLWESISPDPFLTQYEADYRWLAQVFESVRPPSDSTGKLLWFALGAETTKLIHDHVRVGDVHQLEEFVLDADVIDGIMNNPSEKKRRTLEEDLIHRFRQHQGLPVFKKLSERLEALRDKAERGLIVSIEFVKELCRLATDTLQAEKDLEAEKQVKTPQAALTELFLELQTDKTPAVVARIVADIDEIVRVVKFPSWQNSREGERLVQRELRKALLKYKLHKDQVLFERAYGYIREYY